MPNLYPTSSTNSLILPASASYTEVDTAEHPLPFGIYSTEQFRQGCADMVSFVYHKLGGDVLDLEITKYDVFSSYEDAVLTYSYLVNLHQAKNVLYSALGSTTGTFNSDGELSGSSAALTNAALKFPQYNFGYISNIAMGFSEEAGVGGRHNVFTSSISTVDNQQEYDLQSIVQSNAEFSSSVNGRRILIKKVYYKTGRAHWSLYGIYGGLNIVGNFLNYNSYSTDTTYEILPVWEMKQRVMNLEDRMWTRTSHFSYELRNNKLKIYPMPTNGIPSHIYFEFIIPDEGGPFVETSGSSVTNSTVDGVNNINTIPFSNIPYENINSIGKQFIRSYALESCKETLGYIRGKFSTIPIPGDPVVLNGKELVAEAKAAKEKLKEEFLKILEQTDYNEMAKKQTEVQDSVSKTLDKIPMGIFVGSFLLFLNFGSMFIG